MHWGWGDGWGWAWMWMPGMILFWGLLGAGIYFLVRTATGGQSRRGPEARSSAIAILDERFARGEISEEEYLSRKRTLLGGG